MNRRRCRISLSVFLLFLILLQPVSVCALSDPAPQLPYETYVYDTVDRCYTVPAAYQVETVLRGSDFGLENFKELADVCYDGEDAVFFCDAGGGTVTVTDTSWKLIGQIDGFLYDGREEHLSAPNGICLDGTYLYVADTGNSRIAVFDRRTLECVRILDRPVISLLTEDYTYSPSKVAVDAAGRLYVIATGINQGLIELDPDGTFVTFLGAPSVVPDLMTQLWREIATKEQLAQLEKYVPTEYNAMLIDDNGFIYAASRSSETSPLVKLNNNGNDILRFADELGDADAFGVRGNVRPYYADVALGRYDTCALVDSDKGRLYLYTKEGEMLCAFGNNGSQDGTFYTASALEFVGDDLVVTDSSKNTVTVLTLTSFGNRIFEAVCADYAGDFDQAYVKWQGVLETCSHYPLALLGMARIEIRGGEYTKAMSRLKSLHAMEQYDTAVTGWRDDLIRRYLGWMLLIAAAVTVIAVVAVRVVRKSAVCVRVKNTTLIRQYRYGSHVMLHPFDGFWCIKREGCGGMGGALLTLGLFTVLYALRAQYSGFLATGKTADEVNGLYECVMILLPLALWIVANWCFTTLMDGEGSMKDIFIASCYALRPYIVMSIPLFLLSHVLVEKEMVFYTVGCQICLIWVLALLFFGMMITHDYSLPKGILVLILTLVGMCLIIFILLLAFNVVQDAVDFFRDIYREISFRTY